MENRNKIYPAKISLSVDWENFGNLAKDFFFSLSLLVVTLFPVGLIAFFFLILQVFLVGVFDRLGISPKVSLLFSSLFYVAAFAGLAIVGGLRRKARVVAVEANLNPQPICKMLIIKRKNQEIKI